MFPGRYFAPVYFAPVYFAPAYLGGEAGLPVPSHGPRLRRAPIGEPLPREPWIDDDDVLIAYLS